MIFETSEVGASYGKLLGQLIKVSLSNQWVNVAKAGEGLNVIQVSGS